LQKSTDRTEQPAMIRARC